MAANWTDDERRWWIDLTTHNEEHDDSIHQWIYNRCDSTASFIRICNQLMNHLRDFGMIGASYGTAKATIMVLLESLDAEGAP